MNILTFDIEEWYIEKAYYGGREFKYRQFDKAFNKLLDVLDYYGVKATFFCVGQLAVEFPDVVKTIAAKGHEIGCHSNTHIWLEKMTEEGLRQDTTEALKALQDVSGQKVTSYRAPAFSITPQNKWAVNVLSECGIESDSSIYPTNRDFGGYKGFPQDSPCIISHKGATLKEYPISLTTIFGKQMAYSGGGYFRILPYGFVKRTMRQREYNICYFHLNDLIVEKKKFQSRSEYERYYKKSGTLKNRLIRYVKYNIGKGNAYKNLCKLIKGHSLVSVSAADGLIDWKRVATIEL